jgi:hypothetical protein
VKIILPEEEIIELLKKLVLAADNDLLHLTFEACTNGEMVFDYKGFRGKVTEKVSFTLANSQDELALYKPRITKEVSELISILWLKLQAAYAREVKNQTDIFINSISKF